MFIRIDVDFLFDTFIMNEEKDSELLLAIGWFFSFSSIRFDPDPLRVRILGLYRCNFRPSQPHTNRTSHKRGYIFRFGLYRSWFVPFYVWLQHI